MEYFDNSIFSIDEKLQKDQLVKNVKIKIMINVLVCNNDDKDPKFPTLLLLYHNKFVH